MRRLMLCLLLLTAAPDAARAQEPATTQTEVAAPAGAGAPSLESAAIQSNGLPVAPAPPRTLRAYWHVFIAFAIAWALLFGYVIMLGRRFGSLEREIARLEGSRS